MTANKTEFHRLTDESVGSKIISAENNSFQIRIKYTSISLSRAREPAPSLRQI